MTNWEQIASLALGAALYTANRWINRKYPKPRVRLKLGGPLDMGQEFEAQDAEQVERLVEIAKQHQMERP